MGTAARAARAARACGLTAEGVADATDTRCGRGDRRRGWGDGGRTGIQVDEDEEAEGERRRTGMDRQTVEYRRCACDCCSLSCISDNVGGAWSVGCAVAEAAAAGGGGCTSATGNGALAPVVPSNWRSSSETKLARAAAAQGRSCGSGRRQLLISACRAGGRPVGRCGDLRCTPTCTRPERRAEVASDGGNGSKSLARESRG